jgi:hypothetical protein
MSRVVRKQGAVVLRMTRISKANQLWWLPSLSKRRTQYKISKIKLATSIMAITPATESTKACVASW